MTSVYKIPQKIKSLADQRERKSIPLFNIVMPVLLFLMLQYESFHTVFSAPESMSKRIAELYYWKNSKGGCSQGSFVQNQSGRNQKIHEETIDILKKNRVFREETAQGKRNISTGV